MFQQIRAANRRVDNHQWNQIRLVSSANVKNTGDTSSAINAANSQDWENAKPTSEIPGPTKLGFIRGFLPGGVFYKQPMDQLVVRTRQIYGDIAKIPGVFGQKDLISCFNPDDFTTVIRSEGMWPKRRSLNTMIYHRSVHRGKDFGDVTGLLVSNDEQWAKFRNAVNPVLMQPRNVRLYLNKMLEVSDEFLERIREIRDPNTLEMPETFENEISRYAFESINVVALNQKTGIIRENRDNENVDKLFVSIRKIFTLSIDLDIYPSIWKIVKTPKFYELMEAYDIMYDSIMNCVNQALDRIKDNQTPENEESVLEKLLKIDKKVAVVMAFDMLMAGVENSSSTLAGILLPIAKNAEKQEKLRQELRAILPQKDSKLTLDNMKDLPYLRACIKEGMRMYPTLPAGIRCNNEDIVISGYRIPKNTDIVLNGGYLVMEDKHCPRAKDFIPERWIRGDNDFQPPINPFMHIPFGFGPRSCVGMRVIQLELEIAVASLVRNFYIEFNHPTENAFKNRLINVPAIPLKFKFSEVEN